MSFLRNVFIGDEEEFRRLGLSARYFDLIGIQLSDNTVDVIKDRRYGLTGLHDLESWLSLLHEYSTSQRHQFINIGELLF